MATHKERHWDRTPPEEGYGEKSGVPFPGDTLPWNLSKHQRIKRSKSASGEVLDPAERAVIRIAGRIHLRYILAFCVAKHNTWKTLLGEVLTSLQKDGLQQKMAITVHNNAKGLFTELFDELLCFTPVTH